MDPIFMKLKPAAEYTGLSEYFLREGCKSGTVPHIKSGKSYLINVPKLIEKLNEESKHNIK